MKTSLTNAFAKVHLVLIQEFHLWQDSINVPNCSYQPSSWSKKPI